MGDAACGTASPRVTTLVFDLDSCLYPFDNGYEARVHKNILRFITEQLNVPADRAEAEWKRLYEIAGQTLAALRLGGYKFETDDYWDFIREGYEHHLQPDPALKELLESLPQEKWVLTNCQEKHAFNCLKLLGLTECFKGVLGSDAFDGKCKPQQEVYQMVLERSGALPEQCVFFDDSHKNVVAAKKLGMKGIWVLSASQQADAIANQQDKVALVDAAISPVPTLRNLQACLPELFNGSTSASGGVTE